MEPDVDEYSQFNSAMQEHTEFKQQCVRFRKKSAQLQQNISEYIEQLVALKRQQVYEQNGIPNEVQLKIESLQQELQRMELDSYELRFEFADLVAKFHLLQTEFLFF